MSKLGDAIAVYKQDRVAADKALQQAIYEALLESGFNDVEEASIVIVSGHSVVFTAYACADLDYEEEPRAITPDDIELDGDIGCDSIVLYA